MSEADARALRGDYRNLEDRYSQIQGEIRNRSPRYAAIAAPQPLTLHGAQQRLLDADTLLLEYALGEERSYLWAVSARSQSSHVLPPRAEIESAAERTHSLLADRNKSTHDDLESETSRLSQMLLGPVASQIAGKRLLIVADGALQYVPFAALPVPGRPGGPTPLVTEHEIVSLPSASVLAVLRREGADREAPLGDIAVLADPVFEADDPRVRAAIRKAGGTIGPQTSAARSGGARAGASSRGGGASPGGGRASLGGGGASLGGARGGASGFLVASPTRLISTSQEADAIVKAGRQGLTVKRTGLDASRAAAMDPGLGRYRVVHFATHGVFDNEQPGLSGVYLSLFDDCGRPQAGFLTLQDVYSLRLPVELVVLSACNTALGRLVRGEGLVGIVRGFMYAGAERVVASLWKVDDEATAELMRLFYLEMFEHRRSPAAALRQAQLLIQQQPRWRAPFFWAAFVLQGEWK